MIPFAWYRIPPTGVVLVAGEHPPKGFIWSPLYRSPPDHPDTRRLMHVCDGFDGLHDMDFHEEAAKFAFLLGRPEPIREDYLHAYRKVIDASYQVAQIQGSGGGNGRKGEAATKSPDAPAILEPSPTAAVGED